MSERACTAHPDQPYEAEIVNRYGNCWTWVLRCPRCRRPTGERLIRKTNPYHPANLAVSLNMTIDQVATIINQNRTTP